MANICYYDIRVKGTEAAANVIYETIPCLDYKDVTFEGPSAGSHELHFSGSCKWSVNFGVNDDWDGTPPDMTEDAETLGEKYYGFSLRALSEIFSCEIKVHYWSGESDFDQYDHYDNGECLKRRKKAYHPNDDNFDDEDWDGTPFNWDTGEFLGYEGCYDESVDGEESDSEFMGMLSQLFGGNSSHSASAPAAASTANNGVYQWTFTQGKRHAGKGWSIGIPDGFVHTTTIGLMGERKDAFIPGKEQSRFDATRECSLQLLMGDPVERPLLGENRWFHHMEANTAYVGFFAVQIANASHFFTIEPFLHTWKDNCAYTMATETGDDSYRYVCTIHSADVGQVVSVQTGEISTSQKKQLEASIDAWLSTFRFNRTNPYLQKTPLIDESKCLSRLRHGKLTAFKEAVKEASTEYCSYFNLSMEFLQYLFDNGFHDRLTKDYLEGIISTGYEILEFYLPKFDAVITQLKQSNPSPSFMRSVYDAMEPIYQKDGFVGSITIDDETFVAPTPNAVERSCRNWEADAKVYKAAVSKEEQQRKEESKHKEENARKPKEKEKKPKGTAKKAKKIRFIKKRMNFIIRHSRNMKRNPPNMKESSPNMRRIKLSMTRKSFGEKTLKLSMIENGRL